MRTDRRRYLCVQDKTLARLLDADKVERDDLHARLLQWEEGERMNGQRKSKRPESKASADAQDRADGQI
jgi:hypothetical protein